MKQVLIQVLIHPDKIASAIKAKGYLSNNLHHQLEILGILENLITIQRNKIKEQYNMGK